MHALILDPGLRTVGGHHRNAALRLAAEFARRGIASRCLASAQAEPRTIRETGCTPCFTHSVYGRAYREPAEFERCVRSTLAELDTAAGHAPLDAGLVLLPSADQVLAEALARHARRRPAHRPPQLLLWLLYPPHFRAPDDPHQAAATAAECRRAFGDLVRMVGTERLSLLCETAALADTYRTLLGLPVGVLPGPGPGERRPRLPRAAAPTVTCVGFANRAKGYGLLPEAVAEVLAADAEVRFRLHGVVQGSDAEEQHAVFERLARLGPRVTVRSDVLADADYAAWLDEADFLLLPYDPALYRLRGSGVFTEARRLGIPVIAPAACSFAAPALREGWGVAIEQHTPRGVATAVRRALAARAHLTTQAARAAAEADDGLPRVLDEVLARAQREPPRGWLARLRQRLAIGQMA